MDLQYLEQRKQRKSGGLRGRKGSEDVEKTGVREGEAVERVVERNGEQESERVLSLNPSNAELLSKLSAIGLEAQWVEDHFYRSILPSEYGSEKFNPMILSNSDTHSITQQILLKVIKQAKELRAINRQLLQIVEHERFELRQLINQIEESFRTGMAKVLKESTLGKSKLKEENESLQEYIFEMEQRIAAIDLEVEDKIKVKQELLALEMQSKESSTIEKLRGDIQRLHQEVLDMSQKNLQMSQNNFRVNEVERELGRRQQELQSLFQQKNDALQVREQILNERQSQLFSFMKERSGVQQGAYKHYNEAKAPHPYREMAPLPEPDIYLYEGRDLPEYQYANEWRPAVVPGGADMKSYGEYNSQYYNGQRSHRPQLKRGGESRSGTSSMVSFAKSSSRVNPRGVGWVDHSRDSSNHSVYSGKAVSKSRENQEFSKIGSKLDKLRDEIRKEIDSIK